MMRALFPLVCVAILTASALPMHAQRLIPKRQGLEIIAGLPIIKNERLLAQDHFGLGIALTRYLKEARYTFLAVEYEQQTMPYRTGNVRLQDAFLHLGYMHPFLVDRGKNVLIYMGASALGGYEELNEGRDALPDGAKLLDRSRFVYGGGLHLSVEVFLSDHLIFLLRGQGRMLFSSDLHRFRPALSMGFKFNI